MERRPEVARMISAQAWCRPGVTHKEMDVALAGAFAETIEPLLDHLESAWGIIANAHGGNWDLASEASGWKEAAERWRDTYHQILDAHIPHSGRQPPEEPLDDEAKEEVE